MLVPLVAAAFARGGMLGIVAPAGDRGLVLEIGDGDAEAGVVAGRFLLEIALSTIASSAVTITESEIVTFLDEQMSMPSAFTPFSRSE